MVLSIRIGSDGRVMELHVKRPSGIPTFDTAAVKALRQWRFTPAMSGGIAVEAWVTLPVRFVLHQ